MSISPGRSESLSQATRTAPAAARRALRAWRSAVQAVTCPSTGGRQRRRAAHPGDLLTPFPVPAWPTKTATPPGPVATSSSPSSYASSARYQAPLTRADRNSSLESTAANRPSQRSAASTTTCECCCGSGTPSPSWPRVNLDDVCTNSALTRLRARSHRSAPAWRRRTSSTSRSTLTIADAAAVRCTASICARWYGPEIGHNADTDFGALNVKSTPATLVPSPPTARIGSPKRRSRPDIRATSASRSTRPSARRPNRASGAGEPCHRPPPHPPRPRRSSRRGPRRGQIRREPRGCVTRNLVRRLHPAANVRTTSTRRKRAPGSANLTELERS